MLFVKLLGLAAFIAWLFAVRHFARLREQEEAQNEQAAAKNKSDRQAEAWAKADLHDTSLRLTRRHYKSAPSYGEYMDQNGN